jgi:hypothetical protein
MVHQFEPRLLFVSIVIQSSLDEQLKHRARGVTHVTSLIFRYKSGVRK